MGLIRNKKGVVFTVLAIVIAVFFTLTFSARIEKPIDYKTSLIEVRISVLNDYMKNFFDYANGVGAITGYSAFQGVIQDLNLPPKGYNPNLEAQYIRCIKTGNLTPSKICPGMSNKTLTYYLDRIRNIANNELNLNSNYIINKINITQTTDAFSIELIINLSLNIMDAYANLSDTRIVTTIVSLEGLLDPLYLLNGTYNQTIKKTNLKRREGDWNHTDFQQLYYNHEYRNYKNATSFINRIKGNFSPNVFGIESFVNHTAPGVQGVYTSNHSMVDYFYWQDIRFRCRNPVEVVNISSAIISPGGFQLDETHRLGFNISNAYTNFTCSQE